MKRVVGVSDAGVRVGQDHPKAVLTDSEVEQILTLRAEGKSYGWLAEVFDIPKATVASICQGRRRVVIAVSFRVVCMS